MDIKNDIGWIGLTGIELHLEYMHKQQGKILEGGSAAGKLFYHLHQVKPLWKYVAVNTWSDDDVYLQKDWNQNYFAHNNHGEKITVELFKKHCPFAEYHDVKFENFVSDEKFDIVSIGQIGRNVNWHTTYLYAYKYLRVGGVIIGRNLNHYTYGSQIQQAIRKFNHVKFDNQYFIIRKNV